MLASPSVLVGGSAEVTMNCCDLCRSLTGVCTWHAIHCNLSLGGITWSSRVIAVVVMRGSGSMGSVTMDPATLSMSGVRVTLKGIVISCYPPWKSKRNFISFLS